MTCDVNENETNVINVDVKILEIVKLIFHKV